MKTNPNTSLSAKKPIKKVTAKQLRDLKVRKDPRGGLQTLSQTREYCQKR
ncbi:MAG TPA: hypothetical protein VFX07_07410 [Candidatus Udaeobacter sp.]|jgi:hypothetical protein|nr:hypothetical protein [Candidatus Udaeobacter sp.]